MGSSLCIIQGLANNGQGKRATRIRNQMREKIVKKNPGCSLIKMDGEIYEFLAEDNTLSAHSNEIYNATEKNG